MRQNHPVNGRIVRHQWVDAERVSIALLRHAYELSWDNSTKIWNLLYQNVLDREGFPGTGMLSQTLQGQVGDLKGRRAGTTGWDKVVALTPSQARQQYASLVTSITEAARRAHIRLTPRSDPSISAISEPQQAPRPKVTTSSQITANIDEWDISSSSDDEAVHKSPCVQRQERLNASLIRSYTFSTTNAFSDPKNQAMQDATVARPGNPTTNSETRLPPRLRLPYNPNSRSLSGAPTLLFRAFLEGHGFRSRRVLDNPGSKAPPPPPFSSEMFREEVDAHLRHYDRWDHSSKMKLSPFISLAQNPLNALNRVPKNSLQLSFAVFLYEDIVKDGEERYGPLCQPYPYLVPNIVTEHEIDDLPGGYVGNGEISQFPLVLDHIERLTSFSG
jgi:hypothetical protein